MTGQPPRGEPTVSVVVPSHNRPELVGVAVASVLENAETTEVIVVDDGSSPPVTATGPLAHSAVRILRNETPLGPGRARNVGMNAATGDYIGFLDDDDRWLPGKLKACLAAAEEHPGGGVIAHRTGYASPRHQPDRYPTRVLNDPLRYFGTHQTPHPDSLLIPRAVADLVRFAEDLAAAEDVAFAIELGMRSPFVLVDAVLAVHGPNDVPTTIGLETRVAARLQLRDRHPDVLYRDRRSRAFFHLRLGHLQRRLSRWAALRSFIWALRHEPFNGMAWRGVVATLLPGATARMIKSRQRRRER